MYHFPFLSKTSLWPALSEKGKQVFLPPGVPYWAERARKEASINATIGSGLDDENGFLHLPSMKSTLSSEFLEKAKVSVFDYAPVPGLTVLREAWKNRLLEAHPSLAGWLPLPVVTAGITHSLSLAGQMFLNPGDILLTYEKYWENYDQIYEALLGLSIQTATLFNADETLNIESLHKAAENILAKQRKLVLLLNFPQNQTGYSPTPREVHLLAEMVSRLCHAHPDKPITVLLDDAYEGFIYDKAIFPTSILGSIFQPALKNLVVVKLDGISKVMLAYGLRTAFMTILTTTGNSPFSSDEMKMLHDELKSKIGGFIRGEVSNASHLSQAIANEVLSRGALENELPEKISLLRERYRLMQEKIHELEKKFGRDRITVDPFNSGFFCYFALDPKIPAEKFAEYLLKEKKIGVVPASKEKDGKILWNGIRVAFCSVPRAKIPSLLQGIYEAAHEWYMTG